MNVLNLKQLVLSIVVVVLLYSTFLLAVRNGSNDSTGNILSSRVPIPSGDTYVDEKKLRVIEPKMILYWEKIWSTKRELDILQSCPELKKKCIIHGERRLIDDADVVVFHARDTDLKGLQKITKKAHQQFVLFNQESPMHIYIPIGSTPKYFFDQTMTYMTNSEHPARYGTEWLTEEEAKHRGIPFAPPFLMKKDILKTRRNHIAASISNCNTPAHRHEFLSNLRNRTSVFMFGGCAWDTDKSGICPRGGGEECTRTIVEDSYFFSALENSICTDYVTEKYWARSSWNSVPIAWSRSTYRNLKIPPKSIIFVDDYNTLDEFVDHLNSLIRNETAYLEYFEWRKYFTYAPAAPFDCDLCRNVLRGVKTKNNYRDVMRWFSESSNCDNDIAKHKHMIL